MIKVRVPATSANIGPGFDTLGIALNLYNTISFEEIDSGVEILGVPEKYNSKRNLVYRSMIETFKKVGYSNLGIRIKEENTIPSSRGLGSSAACIVAGVVGASEIAKAKLTKDEILKIATEIEGHPDNIAPAIFGGFVISMVNKGNILYNKLNIEERFKFVALIPDFTLSTEKARAVLPRVIDYSAAVENVASVSMLLSSLVNGRLDLIKYGLKDNLHQPYRGKLIKNYFEIVEKCEKLGAIGVYISGAGPTVMCLRKIEDVEFNEEINYYLNTLNDDWSVKELEIDFNGYKII